MLLLSCIHLSAFALCTMLQRPALLLGRCNDGRLISARLTCSAACAPHSVSLVALLLLQGKAFSDDSPEAHAVPHAGDYHFRANPGAEKHLNDPAAIAALQAAAQVRV